MSTPTTQFTIHLDDRVTRKLRELAERAHSDPETLARLLLSVAIEKVDHETHSIADLLDAVPGAFERAQQGLAEVMAGRTIKLSDF